MEGISFLSLVSVPLDGLQQKEEQGQGRKATDWNLVTVELQALENSLKTLASPAESGNWTKLPQRLLQGYENYLGKKSLNEDMRMGHFLFFADFMVTKMERWP